MKLERTVIIFGSNKNSGGQIRSIGSSRIVYRAARRARGESKIKFAKGYVEVDEDLRKGITPFFF